ncbi:hypothetical protein OEZ85_009571 [Tetradesmus obliquus]|uniref:DUF4057 domain-containing protein n=2 Tax=Tetradesmus obliquus TaxID=3088 RepID=A0ABY8UCI5_TETOB|nr:hypothetical protein OEZ85_009571 [Tetradesmus obliquus]
MAKHATTPGAGLGRPINMFKDDDDDADDAGMGPAMHAGNSAAQHTAGEATVEAALRTSSRISGSSPMRQALLMHNPELELEQQQQRQQRSGKHATTPGAGLGRPFNIFRDDENDGDDGDDAEEGPVAGVHSSAVQRSAGEAAVEAALRTSSRISGSSPMRQALLMHNPELELEQQQQRQQRSGKHATTPGAGLGRPFNIFRDDDDSEAEQEPDHTLGAAAAAATTGAVLPGRSSIQEALLSHNSDLALDKQQQRERKMAKHPTTPGGGLGKPFNMFKDDSDSDSEASAGNSACSSPAGPIPSVSPKSASRAGEVHAASGSSRTSSAGSSRLGGVSSGASSPAGRSQSPDLMAVAKHTSSSTGNASLAAAAGVAESGVSAEARSGGSSPEGPGRSSPLRHSSNAADPDPARRSPLAHGSSCSADGSTSCAVPAAAVSGAAHWGGSRPALRAGLATAAAAGAAVRAARRRKPGGPEDVV